MPPDRPRWVAASVGPYGAALADGSEYRGDYGRSVAELRDWHRPRLHALMDTDADVLALETIPCLAEVEALLAEVGGTGRAVLAVADLHRTDDAGGRAAWTRRSRWRPRSRRWSRWASTAAPRRRGRARVPRRRTASGRPAVAYPNSGESWDAAQRRWTGAPRLRRVLGAAVDRGRGAAGGWLLPGAARGDRRVRAAVAARGRPVSARPTNWAGNVVYSAARFHSPSSVPELQELVASQRPGPARGAPATPSTRSPTPPGTRSRWPRCLLGSPSMPDAAP